MSIHDDQPALLLVDDDQVFREVLSEALVKRGFNVAVAHDVESALRLAEASPPEYAVLDLKMPGPSGLTLIRRLKALDEETRIVVLTGYASIVTAVEAIKLGAMHYLAKPVDADEIVAAFSRAEGDADAPLSASPLTVDRLEWEHIQKVLADNGGNISATARDLKMHRRTLQRKLAKYPSKR